MDMQDFQEKMDQNHRMYLCRMLKMKVLPDCLLEQYARVKGMVDRIDGYLNPGDLALIAVMAGVEELTSQGESEVDKPAEQPTEQVAKETAEKTAAPVEAPTMTGEQVAEAIASGTAKPVGSVDKDEGKTDLPANIGIGQAAGPTEPTAEQPALAGSGKLWSLGMPVTVLQADEIREGKIVGISTPEPGSGKARQLTIEYDGGEGETVTVDEDEVEAQ